MTRRRSALLFALVFALVGSTALAFGAVAACSFPDVTFAPDEGLDGGDASTAPDVTTTDAPDGDGSRPTNPDVDPEGGLQDATVLDGGGRIDAGPDASCCDCDTDMFKADGGTCALPSGDCDDLNPYIKPDQGFVASSVWDSTHIPTYDWDCSGTTIKQYPHGLGKCTSRTPLGGCGAGQGGFEGNPQCGEASHYIIGCANDGFLKCKETASDTRVQGCH
jgi:hypothetical protein